MSRWSLMLLACLWNGGACAADERVQVVVLMFDGVQVIDFAAPYEVFGQAGFELATVSRDGKPVRTAMKLGVSVDHDFASAPAADILVIPGGEVDAVARDAQTVAWVRAQSKRARQVLSVCTGSDILAATGLLDGKSATTFHRHFDHMQSMFPEVTVVRDQRWVESATLITSAGLTSGMDAALKVVANLRGARKARSVAMHLEYDWSGDARFVRGLMADQSIRLPKPFDLPDGTRLRQLISVGDRERWEIEYLVDSPLKRDELLDHIRRAAAADPALTLEESPDARVAWTYRDARGSAWRVAIGGSEADASGRYRLALDMAKLR